MRKGEGGPWSVGVYTKFYLLTPFLYELNTDIGKITYFVPKIYANDERMVQFFANAPHLFKTVRNAPSNSGLGKGTR